MILLESLWLLNYKDYKWLIVKILSILNGWNNHNHLKIIMFHHIVSHPCIHLSADRGRWETPSAMAMWRPSGGAESFWILSVNGQITSVHAWKNVIRFHVKRLDLLKTKIKNGKFKTTKDKTWKRKTLRICF